MDFNLPDWVPVVVVSLVLGFVIWWKFSEEIQLRFKGEETEGTITNWMRTTSTGVKYYYPLIEFRTKSGQIINFRAEERSEGEPMFEPGTKVKVRYLPTNPKLVKTHYPERVENKKAPTNRGL